jgi:hypothetical protein
MESETYLIQRLGRPHFRNGTPFLNPFSFGGGQANGGLSDEAANMVAQVFSFDYMGSAQYEWGAVPKALSMIWEGSCDLFTVGIDLSSVDLGYDKHAFEKRGIKNPRGAATVYVVCRKGDTEEVVARIKKLAKGKLRPRDGTNFGPALYETAEKDKGLPSIKEVCGYDPKTFGWLELDNGFFFTVDKKMAEGFAKLMNIV